QFNQRNLRRDSETEWKQPITGAGVHIELRDARAIRTDVVGLGQTGMSGPHTRQECLAHTARWNVPLTRHQSVGQTFLSGLPEVPRRNLMSEISGVIPRRNGS